MGGFQYPPVDLSNATAVAEWYVTHNIPQRYNTAIVVASVLVAVLGAYSTLIVLGKRTSNAGTRNAILLIWSAMTMSCVGIWGMHFIGMNFRLEPVPGESWYVSFSPGFTVFSLVVPFVALLLAFVFVDYFTLRIWRIAVSGILTGCIVGLMHYSASMRCNFRVSYAPAQTIVSIVLACICAIIALTLFFRLRAQWQDSWQRRLLCSFILATGVSGMHYIGSWGTSYSMRPEFVGNLEHVRNGRHGNMTIVIIVAVMCFVIVVASTFMSVSDVLMERETRKKARKIVLASASFDHLGRLLVQADGSLPLVVLEEKTLRHVEVLNALDPRSDTFQWLFCVSWAWNIVVPFLDAIAKRVGMAADAEQGKVYGHAWYDRLARSMRIDSHSRRARRDERELSSADATSFNAGIAQSLRALSLFDFRDRVVDAARRLAEQLEVPLDEVGVFYDHTLPTGTQKHTGPRVNLVRRQNMFSSRRHNGGGGVDNTANSDGAGDEEASISTSRAPSIFADGEDDEEGVSIFLVREMQADHQTLLAKRGYRFTEIRFLASMLADRHAVSKSAMDDLLDGLRLYARRGTRPVVQPGGVYAGLFGVRPSLSARQGGLDVLVYNFARHQIPAFRLPDIATITPEMRAFLSLLDQMPVDQALRFCERESIRSAERNKAIARLLLDQAAHAHFRLNAEADESAAAAAAAAATAMDISTASDDSLRKVMDLQTQEASLQSFQIALYTALEALMQSVRVFPRLNATARVSSDILEVPSSLDDSKPPAQVILVQAVLPADKTPARNHNMRTSSSTFGGLMNPTSGQGAEFSSSVGSGATSASVLAQASAPATLVVPTEHAQTGTPFVFTPYSLFTKTQMMLLRGPTAQTFSVEAQQALGRRYNVDPLMHHLGDGEKAHSSISRSDVDYDDVTSAEASGSKSLFDVGSDDEGGGGEVAMRQTSHISMPSAKRWITQLSKFSATGKPPQAEPDERAAAADKEYEGDAASSKKPSKGSIVSMSKLDDVSSLDTRQQVHTPPPPPPPPPKTGQRNSQPSTYPPPSGTPVATSNPSLVAAATATVTPPSVRAGNSLGIRRFTGPNGGAEGIADAQSIPMSTSSQGRRFARPPEEADGIEDTHEQLASSSDAAPTRVTPILQPATPRRRSSTANTVEQTPPHVYFNAAPTASSPIAALPLARTASTSGSNPFGRSRSRTIGTQDTRRPSTASAVMTATDAVGLRRGSDKSSMPAHPMTTDEPYGRHQTNRPPSAVVVARRPSTATGVTGVAAQSLAGTSIAAANVSFAVHDGAQARHKLDNWQSRQLRDLERFQPNLLLGVLPTDY